MKRIGVILTLLLLFVGLVTACSNKDDTSQGETVKGDITALENLNSPALVFFFSGVT